MILNWDISYTNGRDYSVMSEYLLNDVLRSANVKEGGTVLDVGCGTGDLAVKLAQRGLTVTGVDLSQIALEKATERSREAGTTHKTSFLVLNIEDQAQAKLLGDFRVDLVTCKLVYAFLKNRLEFLKWVKAHLQNGGCLMLISPVTHPDIPATPRLKNISVDYEVLLAELHAVFSDADEIRTEYFDDWGEARVFVLRI